MARPRKLGTEEMVQLVDSFFEGHGDPDKLKCSLLETYAQSIGFDVKAYDFRRNTAVRKRMEELRGMVDSGGIPGIAYKSIDVDALLNRNYTREMLKNSIIEMDAMWRRVFERAAALSQKNAALLSELASKEKTVALLSVEKDTCEAQNKSLKRDMDAFTLENRYLKKSLREYLYPAIANEILKREHILEQSDSDVPLETVSAFADGGVPMAFSDSVSGDRRVVSREETILNRMRGKAFGKSDTQNSYD